jgi:hypothetical protein
MMKKADEMDDLGVYGCKWDGIYKISKNSVLMRWGFL